MSAVVDRLNVVLGPLNVEVFFGKKALDDLSKYSKDQQEKILALIISRAKKGPLIKPDGIGEALHGNLHGFTKIKPKAMALRIIYRPEVNGTVIMGIIAIGPRDREKVYTLAGERLVAFNREFRKFVDAKK